MGSTKGGYRTAATSKMELFVIIVNVFYSLTIITKCSILDVAAVLDPLLSTITPDTQNTPIIFLSAIAVMKVIFSIKDNSALFLIAGIY